MSTAYCKHGNDARFCMKCRGLSSHASSKIISIANANIKKANDEVSQRLLDAKNGKADAKSTIFEKDGIIYMHHQNTMVSFTPEQAVALSEGLMTIAWELIEEAKQQENEDGKSKESGKPTTDNGSDGEGQN